MAEAAAWYARLHSEDCDASDLGGFDAWLDDAAMHARAFMTVMAATGSEMPQALTQKGKFNVTERLKRAIQEVQSPKT